MCVYVFYCWEDGLVLYLLTWIQVIQCDLMTSEENMQYLEKHLIFFLIDS